jgi:hypothetical protein
MHCHSFCALLLTAAVLSTAPPHPKTPTTVICNAYRHPIICTIAVQPGNETPTSTTKHSIRVGSCFSTSDIVQGLHIERPVVTRPPLDAVQGLYIERPAVTRPPPVPLARRFPGAIHNEGKQQGSQPSAQSTSTVQLGLPEKEADGASSASPCCWVVTEEAGEIQVSQSNGSSHPYCWHVSIGTGSYDVRDQATIEAWQHDAPNRRRGVKHITTLCQEAAAAAPTSSTSSYPAPAETPVNGSPDTGAAPRPMPPTPRDPSPLSRLLAVLRDIPPSYSASDFAYVPLTIALEELMAAPLPPAQLQEVARILVSKGLGPRYPALEAAASPASTAT